MSVRIIYQDVAVGAAEDASITATQKDSISDVSLLPFGGDKGKYATFEPNYWLLDGSVDIYDGQPVAYVSSNVSNQSTCNLSPNPTVTVNFDNLYTSLGIFISQIDDGFCDSVNIKWYNGSTLLEDVDFAPDKADYFCQKTVQDYNKVVIAFKHMTLPKRRLRISQIMFGLVRVFERDEIRSGAANVIQQIDHTSRELAVNTLDWTLSSKENVEFIFQQKQPMTAYDGQTLIGAFYIDSADRLAVNHYSISCKDAIGLLDDDVFPDAVYNNKNAYDLAVEICDTFTVDMQADLKTKTVTGILQGQTRRTALQQLCFAIGAIADTSGTEKIRIFTLDDTDIVSLDENRLRPSGSITKDGAVTAVTVTAHSYSTSGSGPSVIINGTTYYDTQTSRTIINTDVSDTEKANVVEVSDCTLISPSNLNEITQHLFDEVTRREHHNVSFRLDGELVGQYVETITPWETAFEGHYIRGNIKLSGFALTEAEIIGT